MRFLVSTVALILLLSQTTTATWNKGCRGGCGSPCSSGYTDCGDSASILDTSGCAGGACVSGGISSGGGYQTKKTTTIVKEERNDEVSLVIGGGGHSGKLQKHYVQPKIHHHSDSYEEQPIEIIKKKTIIHQSPQVRTWVEPIGTIVKKKTTYIEPAPIVHETHHKSHHESYVEEPSVDTIVTKRKTTYVSQPVHEVRGYTRETYVQPVQPVITRKTTYVTSPVVHKTTVYKEPVVIQKQRYVEGPSHIENECVGPCGGSKLVKVIKKTTYTDDDSCSTCDRSDSGYTSARYESEPETIVHKKVTKVISSGPNYSSTNDCYSGNCGGSLLSSRYSSNDCAGGECGGYGSSGTSSKSGSYAFASASASASAGSGYGSGSRGGCKSGCEQWKK